MKLSKYHWLMILLAFIFIGISVYYPLASYDALPDKIPTHFNGSGEPDSWKDKSKVNLLLGPLITIPILLTMLPITWWIAKVDDPRKVINGPQEKVQNMSVETAEELRKTVVFHMLFINLLVAVLIEHIHWYRFGSPWKTDNIRLGRSPCGSLTDWRFYFSNLADDKVDI